MLPTIRQLEVFVAVARLKSFSRAAEQLHMSQPALSQAVSQLESILDAPLFLRTKRGIRITEPGRAFMQKAERITSTLEGAVRDFKFESDPARGHLVIACNSLIATRILPAAIHAFRRRFPGASVVVLDDYSPRIIAAVCNGEADLCLTSVSVANDQLVEEHLFDEDFHFICPIDHPLSGRQVAWHELLRDDFVSTSDASSITTCLLRAGVDRRILDNSIYRVGRVTSVIEIVLQGGGVSVVPEMALRSPALRDALFHCRMEAPVVRRRVSLVRAAHLPLSPTASAFVELLRSAEAGGQAR